MPKTPSNGLSRTGTEKRWYPPTRRTTSTEKLSALYSFPDIHNTYSVNSNWAYDRSGDIYHQRNSTRYQQIREATGYESGDELISATTGKRRTAPTPPRTPAPVQNTDPPTREKSQEKLPSLFVDESQPAEASSSSKETRQRSVSPPPLQRTGSDKPGGGKLSNNSFFRTWAVKHALRNNPKITADSSFSQSVAFVKEKDPSSMITSSDCRKQFTDAFGGGGSGSGGGKVVESYLREVRRKLRK